jgi:hypothetical protein
MMKKKLLALMVMVIMLLATAAPAFAFRSGGGRDWGSRDGPGSRGDEGPPTLRREYRAS